MTDTTGMALHFICQTKHEHTLHKWATEPIEIVLGLAYLYTKYQTVEIKQYNIIQPSYVARSECISIGFAFLCEFHPNFHLVFKSLCQNSNKRQKYLISI